MDNAQRLDGADVGNIHRHQPRCAAATNDHCADAKTTSLTSFDINDLVPFLKVFGDAEKMTINFPQSNEPQWTVKMDGSRMLPVRLNSALLISAAHRDPSR